MRKKLLKPLLLMVCLLCSISVSAWNFKVNGTYYNIASTVEKTVEVACDFSGCYTGDKVIPSSVTNERVTYSVTSIGRFAFSGTVWCYRQVDGVVSAGLVAYMYDGTIPASIILNIGPKTLQIILLIVALAWRT